MSGLRGYSGTPVTRITGTDESDSPRFPNRIPIGANEEPSSALRNRRPRKSLKKLRIYPIHSEPFWDGSSGLVEVPHSCKPLPQRVDPVFVTDPELDRGGRVRFENSQSGTDAARFLNEQSEVMTQLDRFDADLYPVSACL